MTNANETDEEELYSVEVVEVKLKSEDGINYHVNLPHKCQMPGSISVNGIGVTIRDDGGLFNSPFKDTLHSPHSMQRVGLLLIGGDSYVTKDDAAGWVDYCYGILKFKLPQDKAQKTLQCWYQYHVPGSIAYPTQLPKKDSNHKLAQ